MAVKGYQVRYGPVVEAGTSVTVTVGAEVIAKPVDGKWVASVAGMGYQVTSTDYKTALDGSIEAFKADITKRIKNGDALPKALKVDYRVFLFEEE